MARAGAACPHVQLGERWGCYRRAQGSPPWAKHQPGPLRGTPHESPWKCHCPSAEGEAQAWRARWQEQGRAAKSPCPQQALMGCKSLNATHQSTSITQSREVAMQKLLPQKSIPTAPVLPHGREQHETPSLEGTTTHSKPPQGRHSAHSPAVQTQVMVISASVIARQQGQRGRQFQLFCWNFPSLCCTYLPKHI